MTPPDISLGIGSGTHAEQTARAILGLEPLLLNVEPNVVVVVGDVNSTLAGALTAAKLNIPVAHVEAGLRSFDRTMPEEINRTVADVVSTFLFTPSRDAGENLRNEGIPEERIHFVGNVMIDSLLACLDQAKTTPVLGELSLKPGEYFLATLHRPANVDSAKDLQRTVDVLVEVGGLATTILVAHPRTAERLSRFGLHDDLARGNVRVVPALGYMEFLNLLAHAAGVLTDSGGIQEETTVLGVPCITLRDTTERPVTVTEGTNTVTGLDRLAVREAAERALRAEVTPRRPELWDGRAAERIVEVLRAALSA
jgi:UDP-N-acetylglucosamine 2-epimerase (non-hydrolysing)